VVSEVYSPNSESCEWLPFCKAIHYSIDKILIYCRWVPVYADKEQSLAVMSIGFLLKSKNDAVVWRGPKKHGIVHLLL